MCTDCLLLKHAGNFVIIGGELVSSRAKICVPGTARSSDRHCCEVHGLVGWPHCDSYGN